MNKSIALLSTLTLAACGAESTTSQEPDDRVRIASFSLGNALGESARPVGIAVDPTNGRRYVLDEALGIVELHPTEGPRSLWSPTDDLPTLTDLCVMGDGRFIAAADGDGYLIDLPQGTTRQHFCLEPGYEPGFAEPPPTEPSTPGEPAPPAEPAEPAMPAPAALAHKNRAVACDREAGLIFGQPQTVLREGGSAPMRSEIASYMMSTGVDLEWRPLPDPNFHAGAMTKLDAKTLLLSRDSKLFAFDLGSGELSERFDLASHGADHVEGLAVDTDEGVLLALDADDARVYEVPLSLLGP